MYYFIEILYLITAVTSLRLSIGGDVYLDPEGETHYKVKAETVQKEASSDERHERKLSKELRTGTSSVDSSELSSDDGSKEIPVTTTTERTTTKKRKHKRNSIRTTSFTTKYERGTTRRYEESLRGRHHHRHRHGKKDKRVLEHVHGLTLPTWPTTPEIDLESEEIPTIQPDIAIVQGKHHPHHHVKDWVEEIKNKSKELSNKFNHITNQTNTWSEAIKNQTQQFDDNFNQFMNQTNKWKKEVENKTASIGDEFNQFGDQIDEWKQVVENKTQQIVANKTTEGIDDKIQEYNKDVQNWHEQMKNKTTQELADKVNDTSHLYHHMKNKTHHIVDMAKELVNQTNVLQEEAKDKEKELEDKFDEFGNLTKKNKHHHSHHFVDKIHDFGNGANKWHDYAKDKQKEIKDKFNELGNQTNKLHEKKEEFLDQANGFANQVFNWHKHVKNKTKGFVEKYYEAAEQAQNLQQQLHNQVNDTHSKIKDNLSIAAFTEQVLTRTLRVFDKVKKESDEYHWRKKFKHLAKYYEDKFKEFLRTTGHQQIKTRLGTQKVVLNAIDMSKHIVNRLVNIMTHEIDKKGLRTGRTQEIFTTEIRKEVAAEMKHACLTLGICLTHSGFTQTLTDLLIHMLILDDEKFKQAFDSFTEVAKNTDFSRSLGDRHDKVLKSKIVLVEDQDVSLQRTIVAIIKNIVANRNKPITMTENIDPEECNLNATLAFLEVIDTLDKNVPDSDSNVKKLYDIRTGMRGWAQGYNIEDTMTQFVSLIRKVLDDLNGKAFNVIRNSANILFE